MLSAETSHVLHCVTQRTRGRAGEEASGERKHRECIHFCILAQKIHIYFFIFFLFSCLVHLLISIVINYNKLNILVL